MLDDYAEIVGERGGVKCRVIASGIHGFMYRWEMDDDVDGLEVWVGPDGVSIEWGNDDIGICVQPVLLPVLETAFKVHQDYGRARELIKEWAAS